MELKLTTNPITAATPKRIHAVNARRFFSSYFFRFSFDDERQPIITPSNFPDKTAIPAKFMTTADMIRIQVILFLLLSDYEPNDKTERQVVLCCKKKVANFADPAAKASSDMPLYRENPIRVSFPSIGISSCRHWTM